MKPDGDKEGISNKKDKKVQKKATRREREQEPQNCTSHVNQTELAHFQMG